MIALAALAVACFTSPAIAGSSNGSTSAAVSSPSSLSVGDLVKMLKRRLTNGIHRLRENAGDVAAKLPGREDSEEESVDSPVGIPISSGCGSRECSLDPWLCGVMVKPIRVYLVWFGQFTDKQKNVVRNFVRSINDETTSVASWWRINTLYKDCNDRPVSSKVTLDGEFHLTPAVKFLFRANSIARTIKKAIRSGAFGADEDGVYFVMGDTQTRQRFLLGRFCGAFCGWHSYSSVRGKLLKTSFVGNPGARCLYGCGGPELSSAKSSPNGDHGMDAMMSTFAHELAEAASDPYLRTNMDANGNENADICAYVVGDVTRTSAGAPYNMQGIGGSKFLVQQNYHPTLLKCVTAV